MDPAWTHLCAFAGCYFRVPVFTVIFFLTDRVKIRIGFDETSCPSRWFCTYFIFLLYSCSSLATGDAYDRASTFVLKSLLTGGT